VLDPEPADPDDYYERAWSQLQLYALADKLCLPRLMDEIMDQWIWTDDMGYCIEIIDEVYSILPL